MIVSSGTKKPKIDGSAYIAPTAVVSGEVTVEEGCAILHGAVIVAEGAPVTIGANSVVMEQAVLRASGGTAMQFPLTIGESCIVGPGAYLCGATIEPGTFVGAGARVYNGATVQSGAIVHPGATVARGQTIAENASAGSGHSDDFFPSVFNVEAGSEAPARAAETYAAFLRKAHAQDAVASVEAAPKKPPKPRLSKTEEPPPAQSADVGKVMDVMFLELEEARLRREAAMERERRKQR